MMEHDLHSGRPEDVLFSIDCHAGLRERSVLRSQLAGLYSCDGLGRSAGPRLPPGLLCEHAGMRLESHPGSRKLRRGSGREREARS